MKAKDTYFLDLMRKATQFVIPIYQRKYSWGEEECKQLWDDILRAGSSDEGTGDHFIGSVVYMTTESSLDSSALVIDGQQRLTTLIILLAALAEVVGDSEPRHNFSKAKLQDYYLNDREEGDLRYKLVLTETDRDTLFAIVDNRNLPSNHSYLINNSYKQFKKLLKDHDLSVVCKGLTKLQIVSVYLERERDNPQRIFESMNSTGKVLRQGDLIKNFILMDLCHCVQNDLYKDFWISMEVYFGQEAYKNNFDSFMGYYLIYRRNGKTAIRGGVYKTFKEYAHTVTDKTTENVPKYLMEGIHDFSRYYCIMALGREEDSPGLTKKRDLKIAFDDLKDLNASVAYPFLLELYDDYTHNRLSGDDFLRVVRLIEAYVFRRIICRIPTNSFKSLFANFTKKLKKDRYLESIKAHFILMKHNMRFPNDDEFERNIQTYHLYNSRICMYWLRRLENHNRREIISINDYTIEHIMPQTLTDSWKEELGGEWERIHTEYLHTPGNLTLTGYNTPYSNRSFREKCTLRGERGFANSPLKLNKGLAALKAWDEAAIKSRATNLANQAVDIWQKPELPDDTLAKYRSKTTDEAEYSIEDHP